MKKLNYFAAILVLVLFTFSAVSCESGSTPIEEQLEKQELDDKIHMADDSGKDEEPDPDDRG